MEFCLNVHQEIFVNWLGKYHQKNNPWRIGNTKTGRGLIATRDIVVNEPILCENPLIIGPVGNKNEDVVCVVCFQPISETDTCSNCGLPLCSNCTNNDSHFDECFFLSSFNVSASDNVESSLYRIRALTAVRGLFLDDSMKNVINLLQANYNEDVEKLIGNLFRKTAGHKRQLLDELTRIASVLNTNAFQIVNSFSTNHSIVLRALYPVMSLINHRCTPNATYSTDSKYITSVFARKPIKNGEEIFISYSKILWSTPSRQSYLKVTKQFTCFCDRCLDPTEKSTFLSAIKCFNRNCSGIVLPVDPINFVSPWKCLSCEQIFEYKTILRFQEVISCTISNCKSINSIRDNDEVINNRLLKVLHTSNQFIVEMKMKSILTMRKEDRCADNCKLIERYCIDILQLLKKLDAGECVLKGLVQFKLFQCRQQLLDSGTNSETKFTRKQQKLLTSARRILKDNISAPDDLFEEPEK